MPDYAPVLTNAPAVLPVSLQEVKQHLRLVAGDEVYTTEDGILGIYLDAAVSHLDGETGWLGRAIVAQTWSQQFDALTRSMLLGLAPVTAISSVKYRDVAGVEQTIAAESYALINGVSAPELQFLDDYAFPGLFDEEPAVTVTFVAGYGDDEDVPAAIKAAILLMVGDMYQQREGKVSSSLMDNSTIRRLLDPYRRGWAA